MTRPNAKRSGGPTTTEGKSVAASNALTTGAYAMTAVLPGEDEKALLELEAQFQRAFAPQNVVESAMVRDLAVLTWKKMRVERLEKAALMVALDQPFVASELAFQQLLSVDEANAWSAFRQNPEPYHLAHEAVTEIANQGKNFEGPVIAQVLKLHPLLEPYFPHVIEEMADPLRAVTQKKHQIAIHGAQRIQHLYDRNVLVGASRFLFLYIKLSALCARPEKVNAILLEAKEARLLRFLETKQGRRVQDDLDRAFYRTLAELRKQQDWRRKWGEVTVTPEPLLVEPGEPS